MQPLKTIHQSEARASKCGDPKKARFQISDGAALEEVGEQSRAGWSWSNGENLEPSGAERPQLHVFMCAGARASTKSSTLISWWRWRHRSKGMPLFRKSWDVDWLQIDLIYLRTCIEKIPLKDQRYNFLDILIHMLKVHYFIFHSFTFPFLDVSI